MRDFLLTAQVQVALAREGHDVDLDVSADDGAVTITVNRYVLRLEHLKDELRDVALAVPGGERDADRAGAAFLSIQQV